jgi:hypothetical protein
MTMLAAGVFGGLAVLARILDGRWLRPAPAFAGYWLVAGTAPLVLFDTRHTTVRALVYLAAGAALFCLGALVGTGPEPGRARPPTLVVNRHRLALACGLGALTGLAATLLSIRSAGLSWRAILTVHGLLDTGNALAIDRYAGTPTARAPCPCCWPSPTPRRSPPRSRGSVRTRCRARSWPPPPWPRSGTAW